MSTLSPAKASTALRKTCSCCGKLFNPRTGGRPRLYCTRLCGLVEAALSRLESLLARWGDQVDRKARNRMRSRLWSLANGLNR